MGVTAGPQNSIVTDGLIVYLDAYNPTCYAGANARNLVSSDNYTLNNVDNDGNYIFNGTSSYIQCGNFGNLYSQGTLSFWMLSTAVENFRNVVSTSYIGSNTAIRFEQYTSITPYGGFNVIIGSSPTNYTFFDYSPTSILTSNFWYNVVFMWNLDSSSVIGYLNGIKKFDTINLTWPTTIPSLVVGNGFDTERYYKGKISAFNLYNKVLSPSEVLQNYNALKSRFKLP